ncbi:MAG: hypothetical protein U9N34_10420, partial [Candidatus Cloacimonadota bacterium]|nr:hypothetical protein [Candidatus Cloacimonadota bacterium]
MANNISNLIEKIKKSANISSEDKSQLTNYYCNLYKNVNNSQGQKSEQKHDKMLNDGLDKISYKFII